MALTELQSLRNKNQTQNSNLQCVGYTTTALVLTTLLAFMTGFILPLVVRRAFDY